MKLYRSNLNLNFKLDIVVALETMLFLMITNTSSCCSSGSGGFLSYLVNLMSRATCWSKIHYIQSKRKSCSWSSRRLVAQLKGLGIVQRFGCRVPSFAKMETQQKDIEHSKPTASPVGIF